MPSPIIIVFAALLGLAAGSFGTMLLHRLPRGESIGGRSRCPACGHVLAWRDLVPIASFLLLRGTCRYCKREISRRYPLLETLSALVFVLAAMQWMQHGFAGSALLATSAELLLLIAFHDFETQKIPDAFTFALAVSALLFRTLTSTPESNALPDAFRGAAIPLVFFGGLWIVSRGRWLGSGDVFLGGAIGLLLGLRLTLLALFISYVLGGAAALVLLASRRARLGSRLAFAPFLSAGSLIALFFGNPVYGELVETMLARFATSLP